MAIPLSIAGLEKRKRNLKNIFSVSGLEDKSLMNKTREKRLFKHANLTSKYSKINSSNLTISNYSLSFLKLLLKYLFD